MERPESIVGRLPACANTFKTPRSNQVYGAIGERIAVRYVRRLGMTIHARNVRCPLGEIDIIATDGTDLVFVEVKTRRRGAGERVDPFDSVDVRKQRKLRQLARYHSESLSNVLAVSGYRIDVIGVILGPYVWSSPVIEHIESAV